MQVPIPSIIFMAISAVISIGLPVFLFTLFRKKYGAAFLPMIVGAAAFIIFVLIFERSIHLAVLSKTAIMERPVLFILYGAFMAGLFEETARFISFIILKKKYNGIETGLSYGVGHGGIEAMLLAGTAMINNIVFSILINTGNAEKITGKLTSETLVSMNAVFDALATTASYMFFISGLERAMAIIIQISLSVIVYYSVYAKNKKWLLPLAILFHAIIDVPAAAAQAGLVKSILIVEGYVFLCAVALAMFAFKLHQKLKHLNNSNNIATLEPNQ